MYYRESPILLIAEFEYTATSPENCLIVTPNENEGETALTTTSMTDTTHKPNRRSPSAQEAAHEELSLSCSFLICDDRTYEAKRNVE